MTFFKNIFRNFWIYLEVIAISTRFWMLLSDGFLSLVIEKRCFSRSRRFGLWIMAFFKGRKVANQTTVFYFTGDDRHYGPRKGQNPSGRDVGNVKNIVIRLPDWGSHQKVVYLEHQKEFLSNLWWIWREISDETL